MKKTFTINISGIIFHIDEDAFEKLSIYLETIKSYFTNSEGRDEIMNDIESRIAELLQIKISGGKQVITIEDINEVINVMGEPEQIGAANGADPKIPGAKNRPRPGKRFYRDPDNKVLGGVCGGIGAYFNIDPVWIRVAFVVALFIFGSGPLLYIILWMIIPEAVTTAEKLEMRGEPVNVSNIEKTIQEELSGLKERLKNIKEDAKAAYSKNFRKHPRHTAAEKTVDFFLRLGYILIRAVAVFIGIVFIMVGIFLIIGFISSFVKSNEVFWVSSIGISNFSFPLFLKIFLGSSSQITLALIGLSLFIGIPLLMLVYNGIKMIFGYKSKKRFIGISSFTLWFAGLILCLIVGLSIASGLSHKSVITKNAIVKQPVNGVINIYIKKDNIADSLTGYESKLVIGQWNLVSANGKSLRFGLPELKIVSSEDQKFQILAYYSAKGTDKNDADMHVKNIAYKFIQNDTAVILDPFYLLSENETWRDQNVKVVIKVPMWKSIYLSPETSKILNNSSESNEFTQNLAGKKWVMTENGLKESLTYPIIIGSDTLRKAHVDSLKGKAK